MNYINVDNLSINEIASLVEFIEGSIQDYPESSFRDKLEDDLWDLTDLLNGTNNNNEFDV